MSIICQHCEAGVPDRIAFDQTDLEPEEEVVTYSYPSPDGLGVVTDYYCDPECAAAAFGGDDE